MKKRILLCFFLFLIAMSSQAEELGRIQGQVRRAGNPIAGVDVVLKELSLSKITDNNGFYFFDRIPQGKYTLTFKMGENSVTKEGITVKENATTAFDVDVEWEAQLAHAITVYGASRKTERVVDAPAAVNVVEETEIERQAAHGQLPKILETVQGVDSTQSGVSDFNVNIRGFNTGYNRRVLTLIDGVDVSYILLGQQVWAQNSAFLSDLASMEVIRGPGSALYGANAYNGVFNITTKDPRFSQGGSIRLSLGELNMGRIDLRYAGEMGKGWYFKVLGNIMRSDDFTKSRNESVEYDGLPLEGVPLLLDKYKSQHAKARLDKYFDNGSILTLETWLMKLEGPTYVGSSGRLQAKDFYSPLIRINFNSSHWNLQLYGCRMDFQGMTLGGGGDFLVDQYRLHGEIQGFADFAKGKGRIVSGFSLRSEGVDSANKKGIQTVISKARDTYYEAVFGQLDYKFTNRLKVVLASRLDFGSLHKAQISPKASLVYTFNPGHSIRFSFNRAFQRPSYTGLYLKYPVSAPINLSAIEKGISDASGGVDLGLGFQSIPVLALGNENLEIEEIISYEFGYSNIFAQRLIFNINYYRNYLTNFVTDMLPFVNPAYGPYTPPSNLSPQVQSVIITTLEQSLPPSLFAIMSNSIEDGSPIFAAISITNAGKSDVQGVEVGLKYFINNKWNVDFNYTWFDYKVKEELIGDIILANSPKHRINLGIAYMSERLDLSMRYRWVDAFPWSEGIFNGEVKSYSLIDLMANIHLGSGFAFGINISNLLDKKHYQMFGGDIIRRNAVVTLSYNW